MSKTTKYGVRELKEAFGTDEACLQFIFEANHSSKCSCGGVYRPLKGRRQYQCSKCRFQIAPTAGTIFHKSDTPLNIWFFAIYLFSNAKSGLSAKQLERDLNVTYKCAWRILRVIREALGQDTTLLKGTVEADEAYFGGKGYGGPQNMYHSENMKRKAVITGAVERGGNIRIKKAPNAKAKTLGKFLKENISPSGTVLMTDESNRYHNVAKPYLRQTVNHKRKEYVRGDVHTNTIEGFWGHFKRSVAGVHKQVSKKHLQSYLNAFAFHRNNRHNDKERFSALLGALLPASD